MLVKTHKEAAVNADDEGVPACRELVVDVHIGEDLMPAHVLVRLSRYFERRELAHAAFGRAMFFC